MDTRQQELLKSIEFVRRTFADRRISLDYSAESVQHIDKLFEEEFKNGKLKNPDGGFAKFQGLILIGISGYLAQVILKNTPHSILDINEEDKNWFINFSITGDNNQLIQPGQQLLKRIQYGDKAGLHSYVMAAIQFFNNRIPEMPVETSRTSQSEKKKPWWKFGR
jgi:hypothetical protein